MWKDEFGRDITIGSRVVHMTRAAGAILHVVGVIVGTTPLGDDGWVSIDLTDRSVALIQFYNEHKFKSGERVRPVSRRVSRVACASLIRVDDETDVLEVVANR